MAYTGDMDAHAISTLLHRYGLVSDQVEPRELSVVLTELVRAVGQTQGAVVEFGCYRGTTSLYIRRILDGLGEDRPFFVYDSFEGLPEKAQQDRSPVGEQFKAGELTVSKKDFNMEFKKAGLKLPVIKKGWFNTLTESDVPEPISFAFLDGDYYESIKDSLLLIEQKLAPGAIIVVDDYANEALPGAARATDEWARAKGLDVLVSHSLAIIRL